MSETWTRASVAGRRRVEWPVVPAVGLFVAGLAFALWRIRQDTGATFVYGLDDAYIHMAIAKNLARHGVWGVTPFHFASASSSLLWTALLGLAYFLSGVRDITPLVLNVALALATLVVADGYLARWRASIGLRVTASIGLVVACPLPGMVVLGMEHILHILLTIWFAGAAFDQLAAKATGQRPTRWEATTLIVLGMLLATSRYEGLFLVGIAGLMFVIQGRRAFGVALGAASALPTILFGAISIANGWLFFPNSLLLKAGGEDISLVTALLKPVGQIDIDFFADNNPLFFLVLVGLAGGIVQWRDRLFVWRPQVLAPLALALMILLHGHYTFSSMFWEYRYAAYLAAFGVFATAALLTDYWSETGSPGSGRTAGIASFVGMAALIWLVTDVRSAVVSRQETRSATSTYLEHVRAAHFLQRHYPASTVVVNDLGTVTYFTDARILDMFGLGDIEPISIRRRQGGEYTAADIASWVDSYHPAIALLQIGWGWVVPRIPAQWIRVAEVQMPVEGGFIGFFAVDRAEVHRLRANVEQFYGPLTSQGYRLTLLDVE
jgi:hypothetical protein